MSAISSGTDIKTWRGLEVEATGGRRSPCHHPGSGRFAATKAPRQPRSPRASSACARRALVAVVVLSVWLPSLAPAAGASTVLFSDDFTGQSGAPANWMFGNAFTAGTVGTGDTFAVVNNGASDVLRFIDVAPLVTPAIPMFHTMNPVDFTSTGNLVIQVEVDLKIASNGPDYRLGLYNAVAPYSMTNSKGYQMRIFPGSASNNVALLTYADVGGTAVNNVTATVPQSALQGSHRFTLRVDFSFSTTTPTVQAYSDGVRIAQITAGAAGGFHPVGTDGKAVRIMSQTEFASYTGAGASYEIDNVKLTAMPGPGLAQGPNATILKDGLPYRGIGINYYDCFYRTLVGGSGGTNTSYDDGFALLAAHHIPFVRFAACGFWPSDWALYQTNPTEYFRRMDGVVASAEAHGIGLIPSLFWFNACVPDLVGEHCNQWGNTNSATIAFMRKYVQEVVTRYRSSPAIWAWEFGNEYNSYADMPASIAANFRPNVDVTQGTPASRTAADDIKTASIAIAFNDFAKTVRLYDAGRLISAGTDISRTNAWHFNNYVPESGLTWSADSQSQFQTMMGILAPDPVNFISVHCYGTNMGRIGSAAAAAAVIGKPLYVGEFNVSPSNTTDAVQAFKDFISELDLYSVPLASVWVFDLSHQEADWSITSTNARSWQLDVLDAWNTKTDPSSFYGWQLAKFSPAQRLDQMVSGPLATPSADGIPNILKYALHMDPWPPGDAQMPKQGVTWIDGLKYLTLTYTLFAGAADVTCTPEVSADLTTWTSGDGATSISVSNNPAGITQTVVARDLIPLGSSPQRFIRLKATHN